MEPRALPFCLLLILAVLVSYSAITRNGFLGYDDTEYITENPHVRAGLTWATVKWSFTTYDQANWHPLTWLSHALDCQLFGLNPLGHHYVNVLLHAANAVLLFLLLRRVTGFDWRSLMVAALFALHPVNVESVAWAAERKDVLSMMFFLLALHAYFRYAQKPGIRRYAAVLVMFTLALLAKPQVITFPLLLLLWDYWPLARIAAPSLPGRTLHDARVPKSSTPGLVCEKLPLLLLSAASAVVTLKAQHAGGAVRNFSECGPLLRLETAVISYASYLGKLFWPSKLVVLYPHPTRLYPFWQVAAAASLIVLVTAWALRERRRQPYLAVGWLWFLGSLVPMIGLVQVGAQSIADRYAYIPFIGLFIMLVWLAADWAKTLSLGPAWLALPAVCCLLVLGTLTYKQVGYWHDTESFWRRTLAFTHDNYYAEDNLGDFLFAQDRKEEAARHFQAALAIRPDDMPATLNLGAYEHGRGNLEAAINRYQTVALHSLDTDLRARAYGNLGSAYRQLGQFAAAKQCYETALQLTPGRAMAMIGLGVIAQKNGDVAEAVRQYSHAMAVQPTDVGFLLLAQALQLEGNSAEADAIYERVARFSPNLTAAKQAEQSLLSSK